MTVKLDQRLAMSQQLRQAIMLLQYNTLDLKQLVHQTIEKNPLLELEETDYIEPTRSADTIRHRSSTYQTEEESVLENYAIPKSLRHFLLEQTLLCQFNETEQHIAEAIIDALDEKGYLTMTLIDIHETLALTPKPDISMLETTLRVIQTFDPIGVGARSIQECLLLQLDAISEKNAIWKIARDILEKAFELMTLTQNKKLLRQFNITQAQYNEAIMLIRTLNPNPGTCYSGELDITHEPELFVEKRKDGWYVALTESILTNVKINSHYQDLIKQSKKHSSYGALKQELEEARFLLKGLKRRNETLLIVASYIIERQKDFLEQGTMYLKPMNIADVAQAVNLHESTISRVTTEKYIATPRGVFELKYFFPSCISTQKGGMRSATSVKELIKNLITGELPEHALSDTEITEKLKEQGINIARRTVAKYREVMKILPSYQRQSRADFNEANKIKNMTTTMGICSPGGVSA